jgi:hypothetical protein
MSTAALEASQFFKEEGNPEFFERAEVQPVPADIGRNCRFGVGRKPRLPLRLLSWCHVSVGHSE